MSVIEEAVAQIPDRKNRSVVVTPLSGGLTNSNFRVEVDGVPHFVRVPGASTELLAVNRENEYHTLNSTSGAGQWRRWIRRNSKAG